MPRIKHGNSVVDHSKEEGLMVEFHKGERVKMSTEWLERHPSRASAATTNYRGNVIRERKGAVRVKWDHCEQPQLLMRGFIERAA